MTNVCVFSLYVLAKVNIIYVHNIIFRLFTLHHGSSTKVNIRRKLSVAVDDDHAFMQKPPTSHILPPYHETNSVPK